MKLVVGLGNPGKKYEKTRHNVGFIILDNYLDCPVWHEEKDALTYQTDINGVNTIFLKPLTFMNLSGNAVQKIVNFYKINLKDILVIHDDLDLPSLTYKLKFNSSSGGHNGIKSIISCLNSEEFLRLKVGISKPTDNNTIDYVLGKLSKEEINFFNGDIFKQIINTFINDGKDKTMALYNKRSS